MILGCCCNKCELKPTDVPRFINSTRVIDFSITANPEGILPYGRPYDGTTQCADYDCGGELGNDLPSCSSTGFDRTVLGPTSPITGVLGCGAPLGFGFGSIIDGNCYQADGTTLMEFPEHCRYGWKGVQAMAVWPGQYGFIQSGGACCPDGGVDQVKYKTKTVSIRGSGSSSYVRMTCLGEVDLTIDTFYEIEMDATTTVDNYGNVTRSGECRVHQYEVVDGVRQNEFTWTDGTNPGYSPPGNIPMIGHKIPGGEFPLNAECGVITFGGGSTGLVLPLTSGTAEELNALNLFEMTSSGSGTACPDGYLFREVNGTHATFTLDNTRLSAEWGASGYGEAHECCSDEDVITATQSVSVSYRKTISLSNPISYSSVLAEAESLLGEFPLNDDRIYPWRTDQATWLQPLVTRHAAAESPSIVMCDTSNIISYTGEIRGRPLPPGYGRHFNYNHLVEGTLDPNCISCIQHVGAWSAEPLPISVTQWPHGSLGMGMHGHGAHIFNIQTNAFGDQNPSIIQGVVVQKWAETLTKWPKYNPVRPCARDRYLFDEYNVTCGELVGYDLTLETEATLSGKVAIGGGVYQITGGSGLNYTVGDKLYDTPLSCSGVAALRFPTARGICSTIAISCVQTSPGLVTCTASKKHWLKSGGTEQDTVTITGVSGLTSHVATVVDEYEFTVPGTISSGTSATGLVSQGGDPVQDSTCSAHTFVVREWTSNFRAYAQQEPDEDPPIPSHYVTESDQSLTPIGRHPSVIFCSPNPGDQFPNSYRHPWGSVEHDSCYGTQWSVTFEQACADPLWQAPQRPCGFVGAWAQSSLPCVSDGTYDFPPLVEATVAISTTPGLPGGVGRGDCTTTPNGQSIPMSWRPSWLTCTDWEELIAARC